MNKQNRKTALNIAVMIIFTVIVWSFLIGGDWWDMVATMEQSDWTYLSLGSVLMVVFFLLEGLITTLLTRLHYIKYRFSQGFVNAMIGIFFNGITPSATGGQFVQGYVMTKQKVDVGTSVSVLSMNFIVSQIMLVVFALVAIVFFGPMVAGSIQGLEWMGITWTFFTFTLIGFAINFLVIVGTIVLVYSPSFHRLIMNLITFFVKRFKIVKDVPAWILHFEAQIAVFSESFHEMWTHKKTMTFVFFLHGLKLLILYSIPYFISLALHLNVDADSWLNGVVLSSYLYMIMSYFPIPGASGGTEAFFVIIFEKFFSSHFFAKTALVAWRILTFYFGLILGMIFFTGFRFSNWGRDRLIVPFKSPKEK